MNYKYKVFTKKRIVLDDHDFTGCAFRGCELVYEGRKDFMEALKGITVFDGCIFTYTGAAEKTLHYLVELHKFAPVVVEALIEQIRAHSHHASVPVENRFVGLKRIR